MTNVHWYCKIEHLLTTTDFKLNDVGRFGQSVSEIPPGQNLNIDCNHNPGWPPLFGAQADNRITEGVISISLKYDANFLWIFPTTLSPFPTKFTWFRGATTAQWIKGEFAK
jgi:hypothetical protein